MLGIPLTIVGDGNQKRDFTYVKDVVDANILAATKKIDSIYFGEIFNIGSGRNYSVNKIAEMIDFTSTNIDKRPGEALETLSNIEKSKNILGWQPKTLLEKWLQK